ncbi:glycosyltransferase family 4 protein [Rhodococcus antarcticus]|uniref:Glycosyltransferase family 4 protein n=1 Tax=Rhodococcus antarcticus TaxID=2987751 RepID=A0ABY6P169_9NOCA|nr:glycosyltransferase family 4 protein [Rhodococcus antarcticus]UZJ24958.1 glycosyltransferase family 4 protein [Rhodococcus antarcticus]
MRVLLTTLRNPFVGGHNVQAKMTALSLRSLGVDVEMTDDPAPDPYGFDILHSVGEGVNRATVRRARQHGVPVVISPIYWRLSYIYGEERPLTPTVLAGRARMAVALGRRAIQGSEHPAAARLINRRIELGMLFEAADLLLPNSTSEGDAIKAELGVETPMRVVPNAVDPTMFRHAEPVGSREGVLCVGRIEPHKNQLGLLRALRGSGVPVTIVGPVHRDHLSYGRAVSKLASRTGATVMDALAPSELPDIYRSHKVHVLPSWFETTGLVTLEAALSGCTVVSTSRGFARDYFGDLINYCDPADPRSITHAVDGALDAPPCPELVVRILQNFTWWHTSRATMKAYEWVLAAR